MIRIKFIFMFVMMIFLANSFTLSQVNDHFLKLRPNQNFLTNSNAKHVVSERKDRNVAEGMSRVVLKTNVVWDDGSGYIILFDQSFNQYGQAIPEEGDLLETCDVPADLQSKFSHFLPSDAIITCSPEPYSWVVSGERYIELPAGIYDYCIINPVSELSPNGPRIRITGGQHSRGDDFEFAAGYEYTFEMVLDDDQVNDKSLFSEIVSNGPNMYSITSTVDGGNGSVWPESLPIFGGAEFSVQIMPDDNYELESLMDNGINVFSIYSNYEYYFADIEGNHDIVATFKLSEEPSEHFAFNASVQQGEGLIYPMQGFSAPGGGKSLIIYPGQGYVIDKLLDNGEDKTSMINNSIYRIIDIDADHNIEIFFKNDEETDTFTITATVEGENGTIEPLSSQIPAGGELELTISPAQGYKLDVLTDNEEIKTTAVVDNKYLLTDIQADHNISVSFKEDEETNTFIVTATVEGENGTIEPLSSQIPAGGELELTISPAQGYKLDVLTDNEEIKTTAVVDNKYLLTDIQADHNILVSFKEDEETDTFTITATVNGGNGTIIPTSTEVTGGDNLELIISPAQGYKLDVLKDNGEIQTSAVVNNIYVLTNIQADHSILVSFKEEFSLPKFDVVVSIIGGHGVVVPEHSIVTQGDDLELSISPNVHYKLDYLKDNEEVKTDEVVDNKYSLLNITKSHSIMVKFMVGDYISDESLIDVDIFPNPICDVLNVIASDDIRRIEIMSIDAKVIHAENLNSNIFQYSTNGFAQGIYILKIYTDNEILIRQFAVEK